MKKKLLLVVLALAILTSLTAGTLAVYTKTIEKTATVEAKQFAFSVEGSVEDGSEVISLAPTESMDYNFSITNVENGAVAEIPLEYTTTIDYSKAIASIPDLEVKLYKDGSEFGDASVPGKITFTAQSDAGTTFLGEYKITFKWADDGDGETQVSQTDVSVTGGLLVSVVAEQIAN